MKRKANSHNFGFYSHVNYSVTKIETLSVYWLPLFYSHVNYSVTKILLGMVIVMSMFYSHVNYSVTKIPNISN